jgi:hypothetical protein
MEKMVGEKAMGKRPVTSLNNQNVLPNTHAFSDQKSARQGLPYWFHELTAR